MEKKKCCICYGESKCEIMVIVPCHETHILCMVCYYKIDNKCPLCRTIFDKISESVQSNKKLLESMIIYRCRMDNYKSEAERYQIAECLERKRYEDLYHTYIKDTTELKCKIAEYEIQYNTNLKIQIENKRKIEFNKTKHCNYR